MHTNETNGHFLAKKLALTLPLPHMVFGLGITTLVIAVLILYKFVIIFATKKLKTHFNIDTLPVLKY